MENPQIDVLIAGAGVSGLMAARRLVDAGLSVMVLDKGSSVGGRLATQRIGLGLADSGAQFFTARSVEFQASVDRWLADELVFEWSRGWSDGSQVALPPDGYPRYAVYGGFNALARRMAETLTVQSLARLSAVTQVDGGWRATSYDGRSWHSSALILTPPVPQSLALLDAGNVILPVSEREALAAIQYAPCLCGLFDIDGGVNLPEPGALQRPGESISWIADNRRKGISPETLIVTVHAGHKASMERWKWGDERTLSWMMGGLQPHLAPSACGGVAELKRWRYAVPVSLYPERCLLSRLPTPLVFAGDAFDGPRVEGATLSGWSAAEALLSIILPSV